MTANTSNQEPLLIPNKLGRILINAYEEVMGHDGFTEIGELSGLSHLIQNVPPDNFDPQFCADDMGKIHETMEKQYGPLAGRGIALRAGRVCFKGGLKELGNSFGVSDLEFRLLPLSQKIEGGFHTLLSLAHQYSIVEIEFEKDQNKFSWHVNHCPLCWGRVEQDPCCHLAVGLFQEALFWISGGKNYSVEETSCIATGDLTCTFEIARSPMD